MVRIVPRNLAVGQIVELLADAQMTNGKTAPTGARYRVLATYPGGIAVAAEWLKDPNMGEPPSGLLPEGTPVHVDGEPEPSDEEVAKLIHQGILPAVVLGTAGETHADAADFAPENPDWDYRINAASKVDSPPQAKVICEVLVESGKKSFSEAELFEVLQAGGARLKSKQEPKRVFTYYKGFLVGSGFLELKQP